MLEEVILNVRRLEADDLGIGVKATAKDGHASSAPDAPTVSSSNSLVREIIRLANSYAGVILTGSPGTSKSYFAAAAADTITGNDRKRSSFVQFHASYQYEDFMVGYSPTETGFQEKEGPFLKLVNAAVADPGNKYVLVIDELSRADVGRVFGEALTYTERSKREVPFTIANGREIRVPENLIIVATMNPFDRGVDEVDAAFERRFAKIAMDPDRQRLEAILNDNGVDETLGAKILSWFSKMNGQAKHNPAAAVGHAYFWDVTDEDSLEDLWKYQLKFVVDRAFRRDQITGDEIRAAWQRMFQKVETDSEDTQGLVSAG